MAAGRRPCGARGVARAARAARASSTRQSFAPPPPALGGAPAGPRTQLEGALIGWRQVCVCVRAQCTFLGRLRAPLVVDLVRSHATLISRRGGAFVWLAKPDARLAHTMAGRQLN